MATKNKTQMASPRAPLFTALCVLACSPSWASAAGQVPISTDGSDPKTWDLNRASTLAAPGNHKVIFEDQYVRVLSVTVPAGSEEPYHLHPYYSVLVNDTPARIIDRCASGKACIDKQVVDRLSVPLVIVVPPEALHSIKNIDTHAAHFTRVEFKGGIVPRLIHPDWPGGKPPISSDGTDPRTWDAKLEGKLAAPENHRVIYEDAAICVQSLAIPAGAAERFHTHPYPAVLILYGLLPNESSDTDGAGQVRVSREPGHGPFANVIAIPPHALHSGKNLGGTLNAGIRIDFKQGFPQP